jgi:hypothetical protein
VRSDPIELLSAHRRRGDSRSGDARGAVVARDGRDTARGVRAEGAEGGGGGGVRPKRGKRSAVSFHRPGERKGGRERRTEGGTRR